MATYRVKSRVFCAGTLYQPGDVCDESVAAALGDDCELVVAGEPEEGEVSVKKTKPVKKASLK